MQHIDTTSVPGTSRSEPRLSAAHFPLVPGGFAPHSGLPTSGEAVAQLPPTAFSHLMPSLGVGPWP